MLANLPRARAIMEREGLDALLLAQPANFVYATDYPVPSTFSFLDRPFVALLFRDPDLPCAAVVPGWDLPDVRRLSWIPRPIGYTEYATGRDGDLFPSWREALGVALDTIARKGRVGIEERYLPKWLVDGLEVLAPDLSLVDAQATIRTVRAVKTPDEIARCRHATAIMEQAVDTMLAAAHDGITERELATVYTTEVSRQGGENIANLVLGFGPAGAFSHAIPGAVRLEPGHSIRFDLGARIGGYHADTAVSRVWRHANARQELLQTAMLDSQRAAAALLRPGARVADLFQAAVAVARRSIPDFRMEHVGHGIGVEHHENPPFAAQNDAVLEPDMVVNVETLYLDPIEGGFAVEDTYLITPDGAEQWTGFDRSVCLAP